jgi:hypothetical protein
MRYRKILVFSLLALSSLIGVAKDKKKTVLPADILRAQTVLVVVDPNAGMDVADPNANRIAQVDVEQALMKWGRFSLAMDASTADLVITVSKGNGKIAQGDIGGVPVNNRPVIFQPNNSGVLIGGRQGNNGNPNDPSNPQSQPPDPRPQATVGQSQDMFVVYRNNKNDPQSAPLDTPAVWRYTSRSALRSPDVPAVDEFRNVIAESEKQLSGKP